MAKKELTGLGDILDKFDKTMGGGLIHTASEAPLCRKILSSVPAYNYVSCGGFPIGRVIEHFGEQSSLKSYLSYDAIAQFQHYDWANHEPNAFTSFEYKKDGVINTIVGYKLRKGYKPVNEPLPRLVVLVDEESTYTPDWGEIFGIDNKGLIRVSLPSLSDSVNLAQALLEREDISLLVFDSMSAIGTDDETEKSMGEHQMGANSRFWNKAMRKIQAAMNANPHKEATCLMINSSYQKVGIAYGDPEVIRNGEQMRRTKSLSIKFRSIKEIQAKTDVGDLVIGKNISLKCVKNKTGSCGREATLFYAYEDYDGTPANKTDYESQIVSLGLKQGLAERKGAWYDYKDIRSNGLDAFVTDLTKSGKIKELEDELYKIL